MKRLFLLILWLGLAAVATAQRFNSTQAAEDLLESAGETMSDNSDMQEVLDDWVRLREHPLNVNTAGMDDFQRLHLLSEVQINNLIAYRTKSGTIYSVYELAAVSGFTRLLLEQLEPFLSFNVSGEFPAIRRPETNVLGRMTRTFDGSDKSKNEGSPGRYYLRVQHVSTKLEYGLLAEKDPGEAFLRKSNKQGFDYNSAFINVALDRNNSRLFGGDYTVRFGQGLVAWQGFSMGKSVETTQVFRSAPGIRSYTSTDENQFFRGMAAQLRQGKLTFSPFVSVHKLDASVDTVDGVRRFGALQTSGYHRTKTEIRNEKALSQVAGGAHLAMVCADWSLGATLVYTRFNAFMDRSDQPYNQFLPEGKDNLVGGFDWKGTLKKIYFFGEGAIGRNNGRALIAGLMMNPAQNTELALVYRNVNKRYFSYFSNAFTESARVNDEHGLYLGVKIYPASRLTVQAYADLFRFNWVKYTTAAPSNGTEFLVQLIYSPKRETNFYLRFYQEEKARRITDGNLKYNTPQRINRIRLNFSHDLSEQLSLKSRAECSFYFRQSQEKGILVYQDIAYRPVKSSFGWNGRLAYFSTGGYNSRIYAYENDLLYAFAVPALYNNGIRAYLNVQKAIDRRITAWLKLAATRQLATAEGDTAENATKYELKLQIRYHF